jgi:hypothetical protein
MNITLDIRDAAVSEFARDVYKRQIPFATARAINWTAKDFQGAQRIRMADVFEIRRPQFLKQSVKIKPFATKEKQEATVKIDSPAGRSDIFGKFEEDTVKGPVRGTTVAVPTRHVPRTGAGIIKKVWRPREVVGKEFNLGGSRFRGVLVRKPDGTGTIFAAELSQGRQIAALYQLVKDVSITPDLRFLDTAEREINARWAINFTRSFDMAMATAR